MRRDVLTRMVVLIHLAGGALLVLANGSAVPAR